jgi:hypothetical protein
MITLKQWEEKLLNEYLNSLDEDENEEKNDDYVKLELMIDRYLEKRE